MREAVDVSRSKAMAGLIGPTLIAVTASEALNLRIWSTVTAPLVYLNGCLLFVAGLSIIRTHNVWRARWPVAITVIGWLAVAAGLFRMFFPEARQGGENAATYAVIAVLFVIGCLLTTMGAAASGAETRW